MKEALTVQEAAAILGIRRQNVEKRIARGGLKAREIPGPNGRMVRGVLVASLPIEYQQKYISLVSPSPTETPAEGAPPQESNRHCHQDTSSGDAPPQFHELTLRQQEQALVRNGILRAVQKELKRRPQGQRTKLLEALCAEHGISRTTYYNWKDKVERGGVAALADRPRPSRSKLTDEQVAYLLQLIKQNPRRRLARLWEYVNQKFPDNPVSGKTVERWYKRWRQQEPALFTLLDNPDAAKSRFQAAFGSRSEFARWFNHAWELDSTKADILCADGKRYNLTACVDVYSRKAKVVVTPTSNAHAIASVLRAGMLDWGLPHSLVRDNGMDYVSKHINRICEALGIHTITAPPFTPEAKPHVERFFRTLSTDLFEELAGYCGHDVAERKAIESRRSFAQRMMKQGEEIRIALTPDQLQDVIERWIEARYHQRVHGGIGAAPEVRAAQSPIAPRHVENPRALDILLAPAGTRTVSKTGIHYQRGRYYSEDLAGWIGHQVEVRIDPARAGTLYVFDLDGRYLCAATDHHLQDLTPAEYAAMRKAQRREINEKKRAIETLQGEPMADLLNGSEKKKTLRALPRRKTVSNEALEEAANAAMQEHGVKPDRYKSVAEQMAESGHGIAPADDYDPDQDDWWDRIEVVNE